MAVSTSFSGAKLEALLLKCASSNAATTISTTHFSLLGKSRKTLVQTHRGAIRCEVSASDVSVDPTKKPSSISALEQLKTSAVDRK